MLFFLYRRKRIDVGDWKLFWAGAVIGLSWEIPIFMLSALSSLPIIIWVREFPMHWVVFMISHTLWDGGIFLVGVWLVKGICHRPALTGFRWSELTIMVLWGQISAFLVEFSSVTNDAWVYVEGYWWNPTIITVNQHPMTVLIQPVWFFAPIVFYFISLKVYGKKAT